MTQPLLNHDSTMTQPLLNHDLTIISTWSSSEWKADRVMVMENKRRIDTTPFEGSVDLSVYCDLDVWFVNSNGKCSMENE